MTGNIIRAVRGSASPAFRLEDVWIGALLAWFRPVAALGSLIVLLLVAYNLGRSQTTSLELSTTERIFGVHPVTLATAYDLDLAPASE